jgi:branched-chain amino acid transport system substrate-binding protein
MPSVHAIDRCRQWSPQRLKTVLHHTTQTKGSTMKKRILIALGAVVTLSLAACSAGGSTTSTGSYPKTITIGSIHPLTGGLAGAGGLMDAGAKLAVADINKAGGIKSMGGAKLKIDDGDSQGKADVGQSEAKRLIGDGAVALVGTYQSDVTQNVAAVAERSKVPLVIDVAVDDSILNQGYKYTFRIQPNATGMGTSGADSLLAMGAATGTPVKKVAYLHIEGSFGGSVFAAFKKEAVAKGIDVAKEVTYPATNFTDATSAVTEALSVNPDVIIVTGYYPDNLLIAKAIKAISPNIKGMMGVASGAFDDDSFPAAAGDAGTNVLSANYHYAATDAKATDIRTRFKATTGKDMETSAMLSYEAVDVIAAALEKGKSADPAKLRDAISNISVSNPLLAFDGPIAFDSTGQNKNATVIVMQVQNGKVEQVFPKKFAQKDVILPAFGK